MYWLVVDDPLPISGRFRGIPKGHFGLIPLAEDLFKLDNSKPYIWEEIFKFIQTVMRF